MSEAAADGKRNLLRAKPEEIRAVILAFAYFFFLLAAYYVLRPVRDEMGVRSGVRNLPWLFTATFVVSLAIAPIFAALVARLKRGTFLTLSYGFLILNIAAFWALLSGNIAIETTAIVFFVWITIFSVFGVSVFWSFLADLFTSEQATRLYPVIAAGGSLGGFAGSATVTGLAKIVGPANLLPIAGVLVLLALVCALTLNRDAQTTHFAASKTNSDKAVGGGWLAGLATIARSPYIAGIALWVFLLSIAQGFAYNMQASIVGASGLDSASRTQIFGMVDLAANLLTPLIQIFITRLLLQKLGIGPTLGILALVFLGGFLALAASPVLAVLIGFQIANRAGQFAISNPAREALWPVVDREQKYKAKNVVDNAVFRGSDVAAAWLFNALNTGMGLGHSAIALIGAPVAAAWFFLSLGLGRAQAHRAATQKSAEGAAA